MEYEEPRRGRGRGRGRGRPRGRPRGSQRGVRITKRNKVWYFLNGFRDHHDLISIYLTNIIHLGSINYNDINLYLM